MKVALCVFFLCVALQAEIRAGREAVYGEAVNLEEQIVPLFANGYLVYLHRPNRLQVFGPDTRLAYEYEVPCPPETSSCSVVAVAVGRDGVGALSIGYPSESGYQSGIRLLDPAGRELRFIQTGRYVPRQLTFDTHGDLWSIGWQRDESLNETIEDYKIIRKYSRDGTLRGAFMPKSFWTTEHGPGLGGRGYWTMYAADDRVGALFNDNFSGRIPEWVEWDLNGVVLFRVPVATLPHGAGRAMDAKGRLYAQFWLREGSGKTELRALDTLTSRWVPVRANLAEGIRAFLLGADGEQLVYRLAGGGNVHLIWAKPE